MLSRYTYLNAASNGMALQELDWTERFIHEYRDLLPEAHREKLIQKRTWPASNTSAARSAGPCNCCKRRTTKTSR